MAETILEFEGKIALPKPVQEHLNLKPGDHIDFVLQDNGSVLLQPAETEIQELKGLLKRKNQKPVSIDEMNRAIRNRAGEKS